MLDLFMPDGHLIVGLEDDPDGSLRVYLDHRATGIHTHVANEPAKAEVRSAWAGSHMGHLTTRVPKDALCDCPLPPAEPDGGCVPCRVCGGSQNRGWHKHDTFPLPPDRTAP